MGESLLQLRRLGQTDIHISPLGLGTVKLGRDKGVKYPQSFTIPGDKAAEQLLELAWDEGINLLDTAPAYGNSEQRLGELLPRSPYSWIICSKAGEIFNPATGQSQYDYTPEHLRGSVETSLRRLKRDVIDILLIHSDGRDELIINQYGALEVLDELKRQGKIRASGMSTKTLAGGLLALERADCVMATYNLSYQDELGVLDYAAEANKGVLIKKALASGHAVTNRQHATESSLQLVLGHPGVTSAVIGTINPVHLQQNTDIVRKLCTNL